jgi:hypothetical protein
MQSLAILRVILPIALLCAGVHRACAQDLLPSRPQTVVEIDVLPGQSVRSVMERVVSAAERANCKISGSVQWSEGYFECNREESERVHHRAAIWLEWRLSDPGKTLRVLLSYTKLQNFAGSGWARVGVNSKDEQHNTQQLRREISRVAGL